MLRVYLFVILKLIASKQLLQSDILLAIDCASDKELNSLSNFTYTKVHMILFLFLFIRTSTIRETHS